MVTLVSTTPGVYPLPDWAKSDLSDLKGHQKHDLISGDENDDIVSVYDRARAEVIESQHDADLGRVVEGQLRWDDMLAHPLCVHEGVETRGIVRYYDNNNFYRDPVVVDELTFDGDLAADHEAAAELTDRLQAVVPGPYSLADLATDEYYGDDEEFLTAVGDFLAEEVAALPETETLFLLEPSLVVNPPDDGEDALASEVIDRVAAATDADVVVHTYWGALTEKVHAHLLDADVSAVGYDFVTSPDENLHLINEFGTKDDLALGLVDGQNTLVEGPDLVQERIDWVLDRTPPAVDYDTVYVTTNTELFYLPERKFAEKLAALGAATARREVDA